MTNENIIAQINKNADIVKDEENNIKNLIYTIRGKQVMLDSDVAEQYKSETRIINQVVKRNKERFPERFCFRLTQNELENLKSQFVISSFEKEGSYGGRRNLPLVFTEQGIAMLSGLLKSDIAIQVSINIIDAFIEMRNFLNINGQVLERLINLEYKQIQNEKNFKYLFNKFEQKEIKQKVFFKGQIYDSYELIISIIKKAQNKIEIIDNYIDDSILTMLQKKNKNVEVIIITSQHCNITKLDIKKFNVQYPTLKIAISKDFHDRFIIIDDNELYHCGASLKDLGKKCFGINKIEDNALIDRIKERI